MGFESTTLWSNQDQSLYQLSYAKIQRSCGRYLITFGRFVSGALRDYTLDMTFEPRSCIRTSHAFLPVHTCPCLQLYCVDSIDWVKVVRQLLSNLRIHTKELHIRTG